MLSSSLDTFILKLFKTTSSQKLFAYDCVLRNAVQIKRNQEYILSRFFKSLLAEGQAIICMKSALSAFSIGKQCESHHTYSLNRKHFT